MFTAFVYVGLSMQIEGLRLASWEISSSSTQSAPVFTKVSTRSEQTGHHIDSSLKLDVISKTNLSSGESIGESEFEWLMVNSTAQSNSSLTWNAVVCPADPSAKLRTCPATAAWIGLPVQTPCDCVPVIGSFADPQKSVGSHVAKMYSDPVTKMMIHRFQNELKQKMKAAVCGSQKQAIKDANLNMEKATYGQVLSNGIAGSMQAYIDLISLSTQSSTSEQALEVRNHFKNAIVSQHDYCDWGGRKPLKENASPHRQPWDGDCYSTSKKLYRYYRQIHCTLKTIYEGKLSCPDAACPATPQLDALIPPWLSHTPGACFLKTACQPSVNQIFWQQCQASTIALNRKILKCALYEKDDTVNYFGTTVSVPNMPDPGERLSAKEFEKAATDYCATAANTCGGSALEVQQYFLASIMIGFTGEPLFQNVLALQYDGIHKIGKLVGCIEEAFAELFGC